MACPIVMVGEMWNAFWAHRTRSQVLCQDDVIDKDMNVKSPLDHQNTKARSGQAHVRKGVYLFLVARNKAGTLRGT